MKKLIKIAFVATAGMVLPALAKAQDSGLADDIKGLHGVLDQLYTDMLPLCGQLIGVGRGIAGFAALWYIASRVWRHLSHSEPIDFYPLFRPFVIGFAILIFPSVIGVMNGILQPTVSGTGAMVTDSDAAIALLLQQKEQAIKQTDVWQMYVGENDSGDRDKWYKYTHPGEDPSDEGMFEGIGNDIKFAMAKMSYNLRNTIKEWMSEVLEVLYQAAALCINTIRTFNLLILAILGPLVFGLSVFDGFHHTLRHWIARYINVFLWLPVANIFGAVIGKIQENMLKIDLQQIGQTGDTFFSRTDMGYLIFMIIGIIGYFTVPSIANYIMHVGGGDALAGKTTALAMGAASGAAAATGAAAVGAYALGGAVENKAGQWRQNMTGSNNSMYEDAGKGAGKSGAYMWDKLKGDKS